MDITRISQELTKEIPSNQVYCNEAMYKHTSFKVGGNADIFVKVKNLKQLKYTIQVAKDNGLNINIMGNGSNLLVRDNGIRGIVIKIELENIEIKQDDTKNINNDVDQTNDTRENTYKNKDLKEDNNVSVVVGAGVKLAMLSQVLLQKGITGFEFASGIPGTIGGAVRMNAGAYGSEMKDIVVKTWCLDIEKLEGDINQKDNQEDTQEEKQEDSDFLIDTLENLKQNDILVLDNEEQEFKYRNSIFSRKKYVILQTELKLKYGNKEEIQNKMNELRQQRLDKQPVLPSAGSTFKRGEDFITAKLIDECGLKGYKIGGAKVSEKHAGFVVNDGDATAKDIIDLIEYIKQTVYEKTGKKIELEVEIIGE